MRAVVVSGPGQVGRGKMSSILTPGPHDVVVAVDSCGVCGTDLHIVGGDYPAATLPVTPGHEIAGTVVVAGSQVTAPLEGRFVVVDPVVACGYCPDCRGGHDNLCRNWQGYGVTLPGGFARLRPHPRRRRRARASLGTASLGDAGRAAVLCVARDGPGALCARVIRYS